MKRETVEYIYIHVPFCDGKCIYCAFYSEIYSRKKTAEYLSALEKELCTKMNLYRLKPTTIYIGGGTPAVLSADEISRLMNIIRQNIDTSSIKEWTLEANPGLLSSEKIRILKKAGANRISMGVQSFNNTILDSIGRRHSAEDVGASMNLLQKHGIKNIGLDLIASLPGVSESIWEKDICSAIKLNPAHISVYSLSIEPGTKLHAMQSSRKYSPASDDAQLKALAIAEKQLTSAGYKRYEISNYAKPGKACLHNLAYWRGKDYLGLGPGASSRIGKARWSNKPDLNAYCKMIAKELPAPHDFEELSNEADAMERFVFAIRTSEGISLKILETRYPALSKHKTALTKELDFMNKSGFISKIGSAYILTSRGREVTDSVCSRITGCI